MNRCHHYRGDTFGEQHPIIAYGFLGILVGVGILGALYGFGVIL